MKNITLAINLFAAVAASIAAWYWFKASQTNLPEIDKSTGRPTRPIGALQLNSEIVDAARRNRIAATWSGIAAGLGAMGLVLSSLTP
ncbi:hypothetical protein QTH90_31325 [Variovorax sp. J2P1-59]|uniref:hypothetical protein n=1 Tax=Variovorax flavidus TaxID=3053501 RepID=UPI00257880A0|nr:hypothetical protein [Variovorax sp. J2P1-59]MDM0078933.1 hypothetical protein [Variovorax sp. J2P1-59]